VPVVTLTPVFVMVMYATIILTRRDFQTCFICLGQLINVAINLVLKKIISQPRPEDRCVDLSL
jgi:dolichyldiphosphatase